MGGKEKYKFTKGCGHIQVCIEFTLGGGKQLNQVSHEEIYLHQDPARQIRQIVKIYVSKAVCQDCHQRGIKATCHSGDCHL